MRRWRPSHPISQAERVKMNARSYAKVYLKRGKITRRPCRDCGARAEMHHPDYRAPTAVVWLCRGHHLQEHRLADLHGG